MKHVPSWFPGAEFKRKAKVWRQDTVAMLEEPFAMVKQKMVRNLTSGDTLISTAGTS